MLLALETRQSCIDLSCAIDGSTMSYGARTWPNSVLSYILALRVVINKRKSALPPDMSSGADFRGRRFCGGFGPRYRPQ